MQPSNNVQAELAALRARVAELETVRVTLATPPDVDDGVVTLTIAEADRGYGRGAWIGWAFDAADYYEEQHAATDLRRRVAELEAAKGGSQ